MAAENFDEPSEKKVVEVRVLGYSVELVAVNQGRTGGVLLVGCALMCLDGERECRRDMLHPYWTQRLPTVDAVQRPPRAARCRRSYPGRVIQEMADLQIAIEGRPRSIA